MNAMIALILLIPVCLFFMALATALQVYLSLRKSIWPGLVLPILHFSVLLVAIIWSLLTEFEWYITRTGLIIGILALLSLVISAVTYLICRARLAKNHNKELNRMNIQDLD
jgi:hypothetical protein